MKNDKTALFETMPVGKSLMTMALPTIVSQLITMIYNMAIPSLSAWATIPIKWPQVSWLFPEETGFYQPIVVARK